MQARRNGSLGIDRDGKLVATWWRMPSNELAFRYSNDDGANWSDPQTIPGVWGVGELSITRQDRYVMVRDGGGNLHLFAVGSRSPKLDELALLHFRWEGTAWSQPETVVSSRTDLIEWPDATVRLGNEIHLTWHVRPNALLEEAQITAISVWHSGRVVDAPAVAPVALPASPPPAVPTPPAPPPSPTPIPAPTPAPALLLTSGGAGDSEIRATELRLPSNIRSENDELLLIALALLPVLAVVSLALASLLRRNQRRA
jgi:hypothetical protein